MIDTFFNGIGAVFVLNLLSWLQSLGIMLLVFGLMYGFLVAIRVMFSMH